MGLLFLFAGCNEDDPVGVTEDPPVEPPTAQALLEYVMTAYEDMDKDLYLALLDPDFLFVLRPETAARFPALGPELDVVEEERIHRRMFSGEQVTDPDGDRQPAVRQIGWPHFQALDDWVESDDVDRFPGTFWAPFAVDLIVDCGQGFATFQAAGVVKVYVREHARLAGNEEITYYKLAGIMDLTESDKGVERTPWGLIKALYR
jgi:hypothetical protein